MVKVTVQIALQYMRSKISANTQATNPYCQGVLLCSLFDREGSSNWWSRDMSLTPRPFCALLRTKIAKETFFSAICEAKCTKCYSRNLSPSDPNSRMLATKIMLNADMLTVQYRGAPKAIYALYICCVTLRMP